jgi:chromosome segregation ATPase
MGLKAYANDPEVATLSDYIENIESDVSEMKFFLSQIYKAFTIYKDKKEEYNAEIQKLNEVITELYDKEAKYKKEIESLNSTIQSIRDRELKYTEQIKQLEKRLAEHAEKLSQSQNYMQPQRNRRSPQQAPVNSPQVHSPDIFYEKRPYYNDLNVTKVINPFKNYMEG